MSDIKANYFDYSAADLSGVVQRISKKTQPYQAS